MCTRKESVFCCFWMKSSIYIKSMWANVSFKVSVSLLIFCLDYLSIDVSGVLKYITIIVCWEQIRTPQIPPWEGSPAAGHRTTHTCVHTQASPVRSSPGRLGGFLRIIWESGPQLLTPNSWFLGRPLWMVKSCQGQLRGWGEARAPTRGQWWQPGALWRSQIAGSRCSAPPCSGDSEQRIRAGGRGTPSQTLCRVRGCRLPTAGPSQPPCLSPLSLLPEGHHGASGPSCAWRWSFPQDSRDLSWDACSPWLGRGGSPSPSSDPLFCVPGAWWGWAPGPCYLWPPQGNFPI